MTPKSVVHFFTGNSYGELNQKINAALQMNPNWEIVSVSHVILNNGIISVACAIRL